MTVILGFLDPEMNSGRRLKFALIWIVCDYSGFWIALCLAMTAEALGLKLGDLSHGSRLQ